MALLNRIRGGTFRPAWHYAAHGTLWQVQVGSPHFLLGEARDQEKKRVSFFSIDRGTGEVYWEGVNPAGSWWAGVEGVFGRTVLFHGFATPDLPIHKGIFAVDGITGKLLWSEPELRFLWCRGGIVGVRPLAGEAQREGLLDLASGREFHGSAEGELASPASVEPEEPADYPSPLDRLSGGDPAAAEAVRRGIPSGFVPESLFAILAGANAIVEYARGNPGSPADRRSYRVMISILDRKTGRRLFEATILPDAPAGRPEPFFVQRGVLFYVADRTSLTALPLGNS